MFLNLPKLQIREVGINLTFILRRFNVAPISTRLRPFIHQVTPLYTLGYAPLYTRLRPFIHQVTPLYTLGYAPLYTRLRPFIHQVTPLYTLGYAPLISRTHPLLIRTRPFSICVTPIYLRGTLYPPIDYQSKAFVINNANPEQYMARYHRQFLLFRVARKEIAIWHRHQR